MVSKRQNARGTKAFENVEAWIDSVVEACRALHLTGFVANGKTLQGKALYVKTKALWTARNAAQAAGQEGGPEAAAPDVAPVAMAAPGGA